MLFVVIFFPIEYTFTWRPKRLIIKFENISTASLVGPSFFGEGEGEVYNRKWLRRRWYVKAEGITLNFEK